MITRVNCKLHASYMRGNSYNNSLTFRSLRPTARRHECDNRRLLEGKRKYEIVVIKHARVIISWGNKIRQPRTYRIYFPIANFSINSNLQNLTELNAILQYDASFLNENIERNTATLYLPPSSSRRTDRRTFFVAVEPFSSNRDRNSNENNDRTVDLWMRILRVSASAISTGEYPFSVKFMSKRYRAMHPIIVVS